MELEDQTWFPSFLRDQQTAFIGFVVATFGIYKPLLPQLKVLLEININEPWTDCCSGAAGPVLVLQKIGGFKNEILLTDKFPNQHFNNYPAKIKYLKDTLDILIDEIPNNGLVTMFNAFHHFNKKERQIIIEKLVSSNRPFIIAEILQPTILNAFKIFITAILGQFILAPFVKPFSVKRLFFTYIFPLNIITVLWDGIVSVIRAIPFSQFHKLAKNVENKSFKVQAIQLKTPLAAITYLVGQPVDNE